MTTAQRFKVAATAGGAAITVTATAPKDRVELHASYSFLSLDGYVRRVCRKLWIAEIRSAITGRCVLPGTLHRSRKEAVDALKNARDTGWAP